MTHAHTKSTPGPWTVEEHDGKAWSIRCNPDDADSGTFVCDMVSSRSPHETSANARLIARAPSMAAEIERLRAVNAELVAALETLSAAVRWHYLPICETYAGAPCAHAKDAEIAQARAALAKANGE